MEKERNYVTYITNDIKESEQKVTISPITENINNQAQHDAINTQPSKKWGKLIAVVSAFLVICIIIGGYFFFFKKEKINIFDHLSIYADGREGAGEIYIDTLSTNKKLVEIVNQIDFSFDKPNGTLSNNDEVTISISASDKVFSDNKIIPTAETFIYKVEGLINVPHTYNDIKDPTPLLHDSEVFVNLQVQAYNASLIESGKAQFGADLSFDITKEVVETWYAYEDKSLSCENTLSVQKCGTVAYVYKLHATANSDTYYLIDPDTYVTIFYSGIHYDETGEILQYQQQLNFSKETNTDDLATIENALTRYGFSQV